MNERETELRDLARKVAHVQHHLGTVSNTHSAHDHRVRLLREIRERLDYLADSEQRPEPSDEPPFAPELASRLIVPGSITKPDHR